jgi:phage FluMu protein Com
MEEKQTVICAWCNKVLEQGNSKHISHGMCKSCLQEQLKELSRIENRTIKKEYVLTDSSGAVYDCRLMDKIELDKAQAIMLESTDGFRFWKLK